MSHRKSPGAKPVLFIAGHRGMVGSAIARQLQASGRVELLTASRAELDLLNQQAVNAYFQPREAPQPMAEDALLTGPLEPTNEPYAIAKIAGIKLCESYNRQYGRDYRLRESCDFTLTRLARRMAASRGRLQSGLAAMSPLIFLPCA